MFLAEHRSFFYFPTLVCSLGIGLTFFYDAPAPWVKGGAAIFQFFDDAPEILHDVGDFLSGRVRAQTEPHGSTGHSAGNPLRLVTCEGRVEPEGAHTPGWLRSRGTVSFSTN